MNIETIPDIEVIEHLDFDAQLACEGTGHARGIVGHITADPAAYIIRTPCCGSDVLQCAGRIAYFRNCGERNIVCDDCKTVSDIADVQFIPLSNM